MQVNDEMNQLVDVLPDLTVRLDRIKAALLVKLLTNKERVAQNLVALRKELPGVDAASMVMRFPALLTELKADAITQQVSELRFAVISAGGAAF